MRNCPKCGNSCSDSDLFCHVCGFDMRNAAAAPQPEFQQNIYAAAPQHPTDHTGEFDAADISENKVFAMLPYLLDLVGVLIAILGAKESAYAKFHVKQALKITVVEMLLALCACVLCWTIIVPFAALVGIIIVFVVKIICFFNVCGGKAKEVPIIKSFGFLK